MPICIPKWIYDPKVIESILPLYNLGIGYCMSCYQDGVRVEFESEAKGIAIEDKEGYPLVFPRVWRRCPRCHTQQEITITRKEA